MENKDYPNNSKAKREAPPVTKIIKGTSAVKKKTLGDKFKETFFNEDVGNVGEYLVWDVLIPAMKDTLSDLGSNGLSMLLYGDTKKGKHVSHSRGRSSMNARTDYRNGRPSAVVNTKAMHRFDEIIIVDRGDATIVLDEIIDRINEYGVATVSDFYDLVGKSHDYTSDNYGWDAIEDLEYYEAAVKRAHGGYVIDLPKPKLLKRR